MPDFEVDVASWAILVATCAVVLALLSAIGLSVAAFAQGRDLSLWPPRIGQRPPDRSLPEAGNQMTMTNIKVSPESARPSFSGATGVVRPYQSRDINLPSHDQLFDDVFEVEQSSQFYQLIASHYDERNSGELVRTHQETVTRIKAVRADHSILRVLDLGGGTGMHIAMAFFDDPNVQWTYVDHSPVMLSQFRRNFANTTLFQNAQIYSEDMFTVLPKLSDRSYDVVLLSLVLSSIPVSPEFRHLTRLVALDGALLISDIEPSYTLTHPFYAVQINGSRYALRTRPVKPSELIRLARMHNFLTDDLVSIGNNKTDYSFLGVFRRS